MEGQTNINVTEIVDAELLLERFFIHIQLKFVVLCLQIQPFNFSVPKKSIVDTYLHYAVFVYSLHLHHIYFIHFQYSKHCSF